MLNAGNHRVSLNSSWSYHRLSVGLCYKTAQHRKKQQITIITVMSCTKNFIPGRNTFCFGTGDTKIGFHEVAMMRQLWTLQPAPPSTLQEYWRDIRQMCSLDTDKGPKISIKWLKYRAAAVLGKKRMNWPTHPAALCEPNPKTESRREPANSIHHQHWHGKTSVRGGHRGTRRSYLLSEAMAAAVSLTHSGTECTTSGAEAAASPPLLILQTRKSAATQRRAKTPSRTVGDIYTLRLHAQIVFQIWSLNF